MRLLCLFGALSMSCATTSSNHYSSVDGSQASSPIVIGHRGGSLEAPENTMAAFRYSRDLGLEWFELDVRLAADGVVVCHDEFLGRVANRPDVEVWKTSIAELKKISVGDPRPSNYALSKLEEFRLEVPVFGNSHPSEPIPTLAEALELAHQIGIMVEMKEGPYGTKLADETVAEIRSSKAEERVILGSFSPTLLDRASELAPEIALIGIVEDAAMISEMLKRPIQRLAVSQDLVERAKELKPDDVSLWVWTIRDVSEAEELRTLGVEGLISDIPKKVQDLLAP